MNKELVHRMLFRNSLYWGAAIALPVTVMILLDLFDLHTPSRVGMVGSLSLIVPFQFANRYLARELGRLIPEAKDRE
ncbi:MAG: hypothetical protein ABL921_11360 [Pirellula sp.]